ncbi:hypothetical protein [Mangrovibacter plantisponsor]|uniref:Uncharacterized protein n=1 Tax=Mangrovibacter plantisponsor TaxID=451513 RepID=A0A317PQY9_9ENTR|nr:hypothetical protein [Mangrovibacter plantisponsor]PWW01110.1 hypothetical protein DES37_12278 [Mangrovibacter plantisponsor]
MAFVYLMFNIEIDKNNHSDITDNNQPSFAGIPLPLLKVLCGEMNVIKAEWVNAKQ